MDTTPAHNTGFDDLLYQAEQLSAEVNKDLEMPRVKRNLPQLLEACNQLWTRTSMNASRDVSDVRASVLLGSSSGYDLQKVSRNLDSLVSKGLKQSTAISAQIKEPALRETDVLGFLKNERENAILQVIEDTKDISKEQVDKQFWHTVDREWEQMKLELLNAIVGPNQDLDDFDITQGLPVTSSTMNRSQQDFGRATSANKMFSPTANGHDMSMYSISAKQPDASRFSFNATSTSPFIEHSIQNYVDPKVAKSNMDYIELVYAKCVMNHVDKVVSSGYRPDFIETFIDGVLKEIVDTNISDIWDTVANLISSVDPVKSGTDPMKLRQGLNFQVRFVRSSRILLEQKYRQFAETTVYGSFGKVTDDARSGYNLIKNFLSLKSPSWLSNLNVLNNSIQNLNPESVDGLVDGHPVWTFMWHCLRAGLIDAAIEVAQRSTTPYIADEFVEILRSYGETEDRRLSQKIENQLRLEYKRSVSKGNDIYKKAVYCALASCDVTFMEVADRIEDFLWLRLCQVTVDYIHDSDPPPIQQSTPVKTTQLPSQTFITANKFSLTQLQHLMSEELGENHFNAQENPHSYFKVLFLTGQFESAVEFLFRFQRYRCHAVHVAIALNEFGLLAKPDLYLNLPLLSKASKNNSSGGNMRCLNYTSMIIRYTMKFARSNTTEALYYFYLLRNCPTPNKENLFVSNVSELVRETKDFDNLLGYINDFGRIGGVIDRFHQDVDDIVSKVAEDCENSGQYEDAVKIYDLASKHGKVLEILCKLLSEVVPGRKSDRSTRDRLETMALKIADRYCEPESNAPRDISGTFYLLLDLMTFFNYYHNSQYNEALDTIQKLKLLPMISSEVELKAREFTKYPEEIRRNIADILLATMNMLYASYRDAKSSSHNTSAKITLASNVQICEHQCQDIRQKAKSLITFSGMIQYRMPSDTIARLIELEVLIN